MPGSQFSGNQGLAQLGLNVEATQRQGGQDLLAAEKGIGSMQTPQDLAASIASANANLGAAPDPQKAAEAQMAQWMSKFNASAGGGGYRLNGAAPGRSSGPSGGTGAYDPLNTQAGGAGGYTGFLGAPSNPMAGDISDPNSVWWDQSPATGTFYNPATDTSNYDYGTPQAYNAAGTPAQTAIDPNTGQASYNPYAGGDGSWY